MDDPMFIKLVITLKILQLVIAKENIKCLNSTCRKQDGMEWTTKGKHENIHLPL